MITCGFLAIPGASFTLHYLHLFPETAWYYEFRSWPGTELLVILVGVAGGMVGALIPRKLVVVPLFLTVAAVSPPYLKPLIGRLPFESLVDTWEDDVCIQSLAST